MSPGPASSPRVLVLGANGQVARHTTPVLLKAGAALTLFLRRAARFQIPIRHGCGSWKAMCLMLRSSGPPCRDRT